MARRINIAKGMRRLWIVLSVVWIAIVTVWILEVLQRDDMNNLAFAKAHASAFCAREPVANQPECETGAYKRARIEGGIWGQFIRKASQFGYGESAAYILGVMFGPPLLILIIAIVAFRVAVWIGRGFVNP